MFRYLLLALLLICPLALAQSPQPPEARVVEQQPWQDFGDYRVLYSTFNSDFLQPATARALGLTRAKNQVLVNIAVSRKQTDGSYSLGLPAKVSGHATNLMQQQKALDFTEVAEATASYYLAPLRVSNEDVIHFTVEVVIDDQTLPVKFSKTLYVSD